MTDAAGHTRSFKPTRKRYDGERAARESVVTRLAIDTLGADEAMLFLNGRHDELPDRPIVLAAESRAGMLLVEQALLKRRG